MTSVYVLVFLMSYSQQNTLWGLCWDNPEPRCAQFIEDMIARDAIHWRKKQIIAPE